MPILSDHCTRALQAAILAACAEATQYSKQSAVSPADQAYFRPPVLEVVHATFQQYAREQTALHSASARLLDELLVDIFAHVDFCDRMRAATVCTRWRQVSLAAPGRLWSTIPALTNLNAWTTLLDRACGMPVTLERIHIDPIRFEKLSVILWKHMHHIRSLALMVPSSDSDSEDDDGNEDWRSWFDSTLKLRAPILESLSIKLEEDQRLASHDLPILSSPRLRTLKLHNVPLSHLSSCAGSPTLRTLVIDVSEDGGFTVQDWQLISSFPALEELFLRLPAPLLDNAPTLSLALPQTLQRLHLEIAGDTFRLLVDSLIQRIGRVPHSKICLLPGGQSCTLRELLPILAGPFTDVAFQYSYDIDFMVTETTGAQRIFQNVEPDASWLQVLAAAEKLSCNIMLDALPSLPAEIVEPSFSLAALRELTFDMSPLQPRFPLDYDPDEFDHAVEWPYGRCPQLHTVRVRSHGHTVRVRMASISNVLRRLLDARRLSSLAFDNVYLVTDLITYRDTDDEDVLSAFHPFAEMVSMRFDGAAWPGCHLLWNATWDDIWQ